MKAMRVVICLVALLSLGTAATGAGAEAPAAKVMSKPGAVIEAESLLPRAKASAGALSVQNMQGFGAQWSRGSQLFWRAPAPVDAPIRNWPSLTLPLEVAKDGRYTVTLFLTAAPDYGDVRVFVRGQAAGDFSGYAAAVGLKPLRLGEHDLKAGSNQLVLTVFGKAAASSNYLVGVDRMEVRLAADRPTVQRSSAPAPAATGARASDASRKASMGLSAPPAVLAAAAGPVPVTLPAVEKAKLLSSAGGGPVPQGQTITLSAKQTWLELGGPDGADFAELVLNNCSLLLPDVPMAGCDAGSADNPGSAGVFLPLRTMGQPVLVEFALYAVKPGAQYKISWQAAESVEHGAVTYSASSPGDVVYAVFKPQTADYYRVWLEVTGAGSYQLNRIEVTTSPSG